ncbi:MAG: glycosyltransferase family 39 protein [Betaproteobacteria bacterium]|nr:glycosyltransferase family 39 protein [Betaproteobacteria bacterium]
MTEHLRYGLRLAAILLALIAYRMVAAQLMQLELYGDEAYYFGWAQSLEWGYYSKPPMVAWLIWLSTHLCGEAEACLRLAAALLYPATAWLLYLFGSRLFAPRVGFWAALAYATLPMVALGSWFITTDSALLFFWTLALYGLSRALDGNHWRDWLLLGLALGLGGLSKYSMVFFGVGGLALLALHAETRRQLKNPRLYAAVALAFLIFLPNLLWNAQHQFVSVEHTAEISRLDRALFHPDKLAEFLGAQFVVFGPILFAVFAHLALRHGPHLVSDRRYVLLFAFSAPVLALFVLLAFLTHAFANWGAMAYPAATLLVTAWWLARNRPRWLQAAMAINLAFMIGLYHYHALADLAGIELTRKTDPYSRVSGWRELGREAGEILAAHPKARLVSDDRKLLAELIYYVRPHPFDALIYNPSGTIGDQYALKHDLKLAPRGEFIFVAERAVDTTLLARQFAEVESLGTIRIPLYRDYARTAEVYRLRDFKGYAR